MNKVRFGVKLLASKLSGKRIPLQVNIHVNDVCNLRCRYCYIDFDNASKDFSLSDLKQVLYDARRMGTERISLEGGEPLLRNDIGEIIRFICDLGMACNVNTNGYLVPRRIKDLKRLDTISVSMDGDKEIHDKLRGQGSFEKAIKAIEVARQNGIKVHVMSVLTKLNRDRIDFLLSLARQMGFQFIPNTVFYFPDEKGRDKDREKEYALSNQEYRDLFIKLYEKKRSGEPIVWSLQTLKMVGSWPLTYNKSNMWNSEVPKDANGWKPVKCVAGNNFVVIQTNGDLYTCDPLLGYFKVPNCIELGFKEAYNRLESGKCTACTSLVCNEYHHLFNMSPPVILNLVKNYANNNIRDEKSTHYRRDGLSRIKSGEVSHEEERQDENPEEILVEQK